MAVEKTVNLKVNTGDSVKKVDKLNDEIKDTTKASKEANETIGGMTGALDGLTGGAISKFKGLKGSLGGVTKGFKSLRVAIIGTGIGALVIAVTSLIQAFKGSEEGQNKLNKIMTIFGSVVGNITDKVSDLGEYIIGIFENPKAAWEDFKKAILDNLKNRFDGLLELIPALGKAITQLFKGNFSEAGTIAANAVAKVTLGVDDIVGKTKEAIEATKEFVNEIVREGEIAAAIADKRAKADKQERDLLIERAEANRRVAELRERAADKENVSIQDRIAALQEAGRIEEEITNKEIENARLRFEAKEAENALSKSTKEDLDEEARLKATLIDLETARLKKQKALTAELTTATREANAELESQIKAEQDAKAAQAAQDAKAADEALKKKEEAAKKEVEIAKFVADAEAAIREANLNNAQNAFALLGKLAGKNKALQAAAIIGESAVGIAKIVQSTQAANAAARLKYALIPAGQALAQAEITANNIGAGINIATNVAATTQALKALKSGGAVPRANVGSGGGGRGSTPPSINVVGASETSQLAEAINNRDREPVKAYVVSKEVSTAQEMDRNVIESATL